MNKNQRIYIFDLDNTVINSAHRTPNKEDGTLDLDKYFKLKTRDNVFKDTLLPLASFMKRKFYEGHPVFVCTARDINQDDLDYFKAHNLKYHRLYSRNDIPKDHYYMSDGPYKVRHLEPLVKKFPIPKIMFEDSKPVVDAIRQLDTFTVVHV